MFWFISDFHYAWSIIPGFTFVTLHSMIRGGVSYFESQAKINMWLCGCVYSTCGKSFYAGILSHPRKKKIKKIRKTDGRLFSAHHDTIPHIHRDLPALHSNTTPWQHCGKLCSSLPPMTQSWILNQNYLETTLWSYWSPVGSFTQFFT